MPRKKQVEDLSEAQEKALRVLSKMPGCSLEEWADKVGLTYGTIVYHRRNLEKAGYVESDSGKARTTRLTKKARLALGLKG